MDVRSLKTVDLNLLVSADVLLRRANLGHAAKELGITQPAASQRLARLRDLFGDPLLVRRGGRMVLTPFAEDLRAPLQRVLAEISVVVHRAPEFDPRTTERRFQIGTTDFAATLLFPPLIARLIEQAPGAAIDARVLDTPRYDVELERGLDLVLGVLPERAGILRRPLLTDGFSCLVRKGHPLAGRRPTLRRFAEFPHVMMSPAGSGPGAVDTALAQHGLTRHVVLRVATFAMASPVIESTSAIMTLPSRLARHYEKRYRLASFPPPLPLHEMIVHAAWSTRSAGDPGLRWLVERLEAAALHI
ncbi:LysR family transcriptional regulator [Pendulispora brunnea]|uniref:LysR family transcriptional regulator n=1 Tax=Pendulispora brunnea TaxID=2905690 RepID=A0ABZ2KAX6_9BACT